MDTGPDGKQRVRVGHLHLVDLAGSERQVRLAYSTKCINLVQGQNRGNRTDFERSNKD